MLLGVGFGTFKAIEKMAISKVRLFFKTIAVYCTPEIRNRS